MINIFKISGIEVSRTNLVKFRNARKLKHCSIFFRQLNFLYPGSNDEKMIKQNFTHFENL